MDELYLWGERVNQSTPSPLRKVNPERMRHVYDIPFPPDARPSLPLPPSARHSPYAAERLHAHARAANVRLKEKR
jgi:hypothetical protein